MILAVNTQQDLFDVSVAFFRTVKVRCQVDGQGRYYQNSGKRRCPIGNILHAETLSEMMWLTESKHQANYILYAWFGISPFSKFANLAMDLQILHDAWNNWDDTGFNNWQALKDLANTYNLKTDIETTPQEATII